VDKPAEYQRLLVGLVGDRDPYDVQAEQPEQLADVLRDAGADVRTRPRPGEWSVLECAGHLMDAEIVMAGRYRWTLAQERPSMIGYDQDLWVERLRHNEDDPDELMAVFGALRRANLELWGRMPVEDRSRVAVHAERGPESYDLSFTMLAGHGIFHLAQAHRAIAAVRTG
jgi:hypothetical protein